MKAIGVYDLDASKTHFQFCTYIGRHDCRDAIDYLTIILAGMIYFKDKQDFEPYNPKISSTRKRRLDPKVMVHENDSSLNQFKKKKKNLPLLISI